MISHTCEGSPEVMQCIGDCQAMQFLPDDNAQDLLVWCLMLMMVWDCEFSGSAHDVIAWDSSVLYMMLTNGIGLSICRFSLLQEHLEFVCSVLHVNWWCGTLVSQV